MYQHFNITDINVLKLGPHIKTIPLTKPLQNKTEIKICHYLLYVMY